MKGLPKKWTAEDLEVFMRPFGRVLSCRVMMVPAHRPGGCKVGMVQMSSPDEASLAIAALNGTIPRGATKPLQVRLARNAPRQGGEAPPSQLAYLPLPVGYSLNHPVAPSAYYMQQAASNQGPLLAQLRTMQQLASQWQPGMAGTIQVPYGGLVDPLTAQAQHLAQQQQQQQQRFAMARAAPSATVFGASVVAMPSGAAGALHPTQQQVPWHPQAQPSGAAAQAQLINVQAVPSMQPSTWLAALPTSPHVADMDMATLQQLMILQSQRQLYAADVSGVDSTLPASTWMAAQAVPTAQEATDPSDARNAQVDQQLLMAMAAVNLGATVPSGYGGLPETASVQGGTAGGVGGWAEDAGARAGVSGVSGVAGVGSAMRPGQDTGAGDGASGSHNMGPSQASADHKGPPQ